MTDLWITLGPSSLAFQSELFGLGVSAVRLTFSYGTPKLQEERALAIRAAASGAELRCLTIADLPGEKVRLGLFDNADSVSVHPRQEFTLVNSRREEPGANGRIPVPHANFMASLRVGDMLIVGDGSVELSVTAKSSSEVRVRSDHGGIMNQTRGITLQNGKFTPVCMTNDDKANLAFVAQSGAFDMVALSFVSSAEDVRVARQILSERGSRIPIVAKIETGPGVDAAKDIADAADMIMAARGDLALYMPWLELPGLVKRIASAADEAGTPWVLATQVVEGMEQFSFPTRAEICDLAHWIESGCAAVMLSYETVFGRDSLSAIRSTKAMIDRWGR